jgi:hypothetical protein
MFIFFFILVSFDLNAIIDVLGLLERIEVLIILNYISFSTSKCVCHFRFFFLVKVFLFLFCCRLN